jgi:hypothetical protein
MSNAFLSGGGGGGGVAISKCDFDFGPFRFIVRPTLPQWVLGSLSLGVKRPGCEA